MEWTRTDTHCTSFVNTCHSAHACMTPPSTVNQLPRGSAVHYMSSCTQPAVQTITHAVHSGDILHARTQHAQLYSSGTQGSNSSARASDQYNCKPNT